jgi:hypothetical protein
MMRLLALLRINRNVSAVIDCLLCLEVWFHATAAAGNGQQWLEQRIHCGWY